MKLVLLSVLICVYALVQGAFTYYPSPDWLIHVSQILHATLAHLLLAKRIVGRIPIVSRTCLLSVTISARPGQVGNADAYLDKVLENARTDPIISSKIDPMIIDDVSFDGGSLTKVSGPLDSRSFILELDGLSTVCYT